MAQAILNDGLEFDAFSSDIKSAFERSPRPIELAPGTVLSRFVTPRESNPLGPWWTTPGTLERLVDFAIGSEKSLSAAGRLRLAVRYDWSFTMSRVLFVRLDRLANAWAGSAAKQPIVSGFGGWWLPGGAFQIFLPNLTAPDVTRLGWGNAVGRQLVGTA